MWKCRLSCITGECTTRVCKLGPCKVKRERVCKNGKQRVRVHVFVCVGQSYSSVRIGHYLSCCPTYSLTNMASLEPEVCSVPSKTTGVI